MKVEQARRLKSPEKENSPLKEVVVEQALDIVILKDAASENWWPGTEEASGGRDSAAVGRLRASGMSGAASVEVGPASAESRGV